MQTLPIGVQDFVQLRQDNLLYVDKTAKLLELVENGRRYFLSRPRRFGKSLTISTLGAMFSGRAELFKGLAAEEWVSRQALKPSPVLRFDMSVIASHASNEVKQSLKEIIGQKADDFAIEIRSQTLAGMFTDLIRGISRVHGAVVVLIVEYDKPVLDNIDNVSKANEIREVLRSLYTTLKGCDEYLRFVLITGISKFSKAGVFSAMNNLEDISMDEQFGDIVGYTQEELEAYFSEWIEHASGRMSITPDELLSGFKNYYDGFSFDGHRRLYNPFSVMQALKKCTLKNYWYISGSPTFIVKYMKEHSILDPDEYRHIEVSSDFADSHAIESSTPESFLYQSGYLTIEKIERDSLTLDYPNEEVKKSLVRMYLDEIYHMLKSTRLADGLMSSSS